jgi:hypothetical protein
MLKEVKVTPAMRRAKALLHKACPERTVQQLSVNDKDLARYVAPVSMVLIRKWIEADKDFWPWFLTPVDHDGEMLKARELAQAHLVEVLELRLKRDDGSIDYDVLKARQKAVELILARDKPMVTVENKTLHATQNTLPPGAVPKGLRGKTPGMIEAKVLSLSSSSVRESDYVDVPEEDEI